MNEKKPMKYCFFLGFAASNVDICPVQGESEGTLP